MLKLSFSFPSLAAMNTFLATAATAINALPTTDASAGLQHAVNAALGEPPEDNAPMNTNAPALDKDGLPWDARIHSDNKAVNGDGRWRKRRGASPQDIVNVEAQLRASLAATQHVAPIVPPQSFAPPPTAFVPPPAAIVPPPPVVAATVPPQMPPPPAIGGVMPFAEFVQILAQQMMPGGPLTQSDMEYLHGPQGVNCGSMMAYQNDDVLRQKVIDTLRAWNKFPAA